MYPDKVKNFVLSADRALEEMSLRSPDGVEQGASDLSLAWVTLASEVLTCTGF